MGNQGKESLLSRRIVEVGLIALLYAITGRLGFLLAIHPGNVTAVWAPSGIAFAAVILFGYRACLPIWLGSFILNAWFLTNFADWTFNNLSMAFFIAVGSTLQAAFAGFLLHRTIGSRAALDRPQDAFKYVGVSILSCVVAATIGVTTLYWGGLIPWAKYPYTWVTWWAGDLGGVLVVTSFILTWRKIPPLVKDPRRLGELVLFLVLLCFVSQEIVFGDWPSFGHSHYSAVFLFFPFLVGAAARFGASGVTFAVLAIELLSLWGTRNGFGPFALGSLNESLLLLESFLGTIALSGLSLASVLNEWQNAKESLENFALKLETRVAERTWQLGESNRNLQLARDEAIEAANLKSAFVSTVSHELRTPLNGIIGASQLLGSDAAADSRKELLKILQDSAQSLLVIVNDILDLAKLEAGRMVFENEPFNVLYLVRDSARLMAVAANAKGIMLKTSIDHRIPELVRGDCERVRQALLNLIGNAIKFTDVGQVCVEATLFAEDEEAVTIQFNIRDTGIGILEHEQRLLFQPFVQVDHSDTRKYPGTGLGLSISKQLVEMMGGSIGVESTKGEGSLFWFLLSFGRCIDQAGEFKPVDPKPKPETAELVGKAALVVEDNQLIRTLVEKQLSSLGIKTKTVSNGQQAVDAVTEHQFDIILMDCQMPELDGFEATDRIRQIEQNQGPKRSLIVALTAGVMQGDREKCLAAGMDDYLAKPVSMNDLTVVLRRWLVKHSQIDKG